MNTKYVEFDTRKATLHIMDCLPSSIQSCLYTVRTKRGILSQVVVHRLGYNSDTFKGAE